MPGNTKRRKRKKHKGTQGGSVDQRGRRRPKSRQEAMSQARNQKGKGRTPPGLKPPTWSGAAKRGVLFALLLFPISLLFGQPPVGAAALTVIAAAVYVPLGYHTDRFFYGRRLAREQKEKLAKKQERGG